MNKKIIGSISAVILVASTILNPALADSIPAINFEDPPYTLGNINGQEGWSKTGAYDVEVDNVSDFSNASGFGFEDQALRISNAVASGSFGDQTISPSLTSPAGESAETHFEASFEIGSTQATQQAGLAISVSPDDGNGSRMSFVRFDDQADGIHVIFSDVTNIGPLGTVSTFNLEDVATISRTSDHMIKFVIDFVPGPSNDIVKLYVDGVLEKTGTTWEDYYRFDPEQTGNGNVVPTTSNLIFLARGTAAPATSGNGYLFDNVTLSSTTLDALTVPVIESPAHNATIATSAFDKVDWSNTTGGIAPYEYQYEAYADAAYTSLIYSSGWLTNSEIPTPGTPPGDYYLRVRARDANLTTTDWSNGASDPYKITVTADPVITVTPSSTLTPTPTLSNVPAECSAMTFTNVINGTNGSDSINGTNGNDLILAGNGSDKVDGRGGNDCIVGANGSDKLLGGNGEDVILGGNGSDTLEGGNNADMLFGEQGPDTLRGDNGPDTLDGGAGPDAARGGDGADTCTAESEQQCEL